MHSLTHTHTHTRCRLQSLEEFAGRVKRVSEVVGDDPSSHLFDPVNAFQLVNRYYKGWMTLHDDLYQDNAQGKLLLPSPFVVRVWPCKNTFNHAPTVPHPSLLPPLPSPPHTHSHRSHGQYFYEPVSLSLKRRFLRCHHCHPQTPRYLPAAASCDC